MKALLICNNKEVVHKASLMLEEAGYDVIAYSWLLKALDNFIEIAPHLVIISTEDYPRHWKTFIQYARSGVIEQSPQFILYAGANFGEKEEEKAGILRIKGVFSSIDEEGLKKFKEILLDGRPAQPGNDAPLPQSEITSLIDSLRADAPAEDTRGIAVSAQDLIGMKRVDVAELMRNDNKDVSFMFTEPGTGEFVSGLVRNYTGSNFDFVPYDKKVLTLISEGQRLSVCTLIADGAVSHTAVFAARPDEEAVHLSLGG